MVFFFQAHWVLTIRYMPWAMSHEQYPTIKIKCFVNISWTLNTLFNNIQNEVRLSIIRRWKYFAYSVMIWFALNCCSVLCCAVFCSAIILHSYGFIGQSEQRYNTSYKLIVIQIISTMSCDGIENGIQKYI